MVFAPRSATPWWIGPNLYMWFDWLLPEPAFKKENIPAISKVDLWCVTVYGPAKIAHASPCMPWQLLKKSDSPAE